MPKNAKKIQPLTKSKASMLGKCKKSEGYIYLSYCPNSTWECGVIVLPLPKIGRSCNPELRVKKGSSSTFVPSEFIVVKKWRCNDVDNFDEYLKLMLAKFACPGPNGEKEHYMLGLKEAASLVSAYLKTFKIRKEEIERVNLVTKSALLAKEAQEVNAQSARLFVPKSSPKNAIDALAVCRAEALSGAACAERFGGEIRGDLGRLGLYGRRGGLTIASHLKRYDAEGVIRQLAAEQPTMKALCAALKEDPTITSKDASDILRKAFPVRWSSPSTIKKNAMQALQWAKFLESPHWARDDPDTPIKYNPANFNHREKQGRPEVFDDSVWKKRRQDQLLLGEITVNDIARESGAAVSTVYLHFQTPRSKARRLAR